MNRRDLFTLVGMGLIGTVAAKCLPGARAHRVKPVVPLPRPPTGPWRMVAWREQEFGDELGRRAEWWVDQIGFCGIFQDRETLELRRQAVRLDSHPEVRDNRQDNRTYARKLLGIWCDDLNADWPPDIFRRATQQYWIYDQHDELVGWHYDDPWLDSDYGGYHALGPRYWYSSAYAVAR
jgi:hypothetical protein